MVKSGKYLTFFLKQETYGVPIEFVREIIGITDITPVPNMPSFVKGVINLRGKIVPVMDLNIKFGMEQTISNRETCIVVVNIDDFSMGIIIDAVREVIDFTDDQIEPAPKINRPDHDNFIMGMGKVDQLVVILVNLSLVLSKEHISTIINVGDGPVGSSVVGEAEKIVS